MLIGIRDLPLVLGGEELLDKNNTKPEEAKIAQNSRDSPKKIVGMGQVAGEKEETSREDARRMESNRVR